MIRSAYSKGFVGFASSQVGEDSLSHHVDMELGVYMVDRFTYHLLEFLETIAPNAAKKLRKGGCQYCFVFFFTIYISNRIYIIYRVLKS